MDAKEFKVTDVLSRDERFVVPLYQRQYQWHDNRDGNGNNAFWLDIAAKAGDILHKRARFEHYMGALLLEPGTTPRAFGMTPVMQVVDGQQRLTTFLILIAAIREIALQYGFESIANNCKSYLYNQPGHADTDDLVKYKLTPTPVDRDIFFDIIERRLEDIRERHAQHYWGRGIPNNTRFRSLRAYEFFISKVNRFIDAGPEEDADIEDELGEIESKEDHNAAFDRLNALLEALVFHLKLIVITLGAEDDAQVIFETLNSAGQPLLAMDLVRNDIFHRAEAEYQNEHNARERTEKLYNEVWLPFDDSWWRIQAPNARPYRPRIDHFLANVLTSETGERITIRELYAEYRAWAMPKRKPRFDTIEEELGILRGHAPTYETLEGAKRTDETINRLGDQLRIWQQTTPYPIAFQISSPDVDQKTGNAVARLIDSYLTRRILCGLTSKNLNRLFPRLANHLRVHGVTVNNIDQFFEHLDGPAVRFPDDDEFRQGILETRIYGQASSRILSQILWMLELKSRTPKTEATERPMLSVEHVMPQAWGTHWPILDEDGNPIDELDALLGLAYERYQKRRSAVDTLGNLTIVTIALNAELSNLPFKDKKRKLEEHSNLTLNRKIAEESDWNEAAIRRRGEALADLACKIWPTPSVFL